MEIEDELVAGWYNLLHYCMSDTMNQKEFKIKHDAWANRWARAGLYTQGEVSHRLQLSQPNV